MTPEKKPPRFINQILIYGLGLAFNYGIGFILLPVYSRLMPESQYGVLEIINRSIEIIALLLLAQFGITFIRFYREKTDDDYRRLVTSTCIYLILAVAVAVGGAMALLRDELALLLFKSREYSPYLMIAAVKYFVIMVFIVPYAYFQAREEPGRFIILSAVHFATVLGLNILFLSVMADKVAAVLYAGTLGPLIFLLTVGIWVFLHSARRFDLAIGRQIVSFSWSFTFVGVFGFIMVNGDRYFLNEYCGKAQTGLYAFGYKIGMVLNAFVFAPIIRAWNAKMVDVLRREEGTRYLARLTTYALLLYCIAALALSIYSREVIGVFMGERYFESYRVIPLILFAYAFWGVSLFFDTGVYITKKTYLKTWHAFTTAVCLALYFWLIPRNCMMGAAWATIGTYFTFAVLSWYLNTRALPTSYEFGKMIKILLPAVALYLVNLQFEGWETDNLDHIRTAASLIWPPLYTLLIIAIKLLLLSCYVPAIWIMRVLEPEDHDRIRSLYNDLKSKVSSRERERIVPAPESHLE
ncbi:MAG: lipopolysaccharide biosynthesis protein [candidate division Zixibacteria bacterium]|nr:lipopolysaccharide biosynthesis protein [candidate division Zixibacteria bacterium]